MASLMAPLHTPATASRPAIRSSTTETPRNLLNLDCSSDLSRYSRDLGPGVQAKNVSYRSDALRAQFERHRDHILRHGQPVGSPGPGQELARSVPQAGSALHASAPHVSAPPRSYSAVSSPRTPVPPVGQVPHYHLHGSFAQSQVLPTRAVPQVPEPGDVETYPPALRQALDKSAHILTNALPERDGTIYHVMDDMQSTYSKDESSVVGTYTTLRSAVQESVEHFIKEYGGCFDYADPTFEVKDDGQIHMDIETDGSMGGLCSVYVRRGRLGK